MSSLFRRAAKNLPLTPEERVVLKFVMMAIAVAALTGGAAAVQFVASAGHHIDWSTVLMVFLGAFGVSLYETGRKWVTAHADGPIGVATQLLTAAIQKAALPAPAATTVTSAKEPAK